MAEQEKQGPLESRTVQAALLSVVTSLVGHFYPPVGEWINAHATEILGAFGAWVAMARTGGDQKIDWKKWGAVTILSKKV